MATSDDGGDGEFKLDAALAAGISVDVVLAIVAAVLIYFWRKRISDKRQVRRRLWYNEMFNNRASVRSELVSMAAEEHERERSRTEEPKQVNAVAPVMRATTRSYQSAGHSDENGTDAERVEGNFAFLYNHMGQQPEVSREDNEEGGAGELRRSRVTFSDLPGEEETEGQHYPAKSDDRIIHNPLSSSLSTHGDIANAYENAEYMNNGNMTLTTYYTYSPPSNHLDGEASEILSDGDRSPPVFATPPHPTTIPPPPPPPHLDLIQAIIVGTGSDVDLTLPSPPEMSSNPLYQTLGNVQAGEDGDNEGEEDADSKSWSTMNFGEENVSQLYKIEMEESTDIL